MRDNTKEIVFALAIFVVTNLFSLLYQPQISFRDGKGYDGVDYFELAERVVHREPVRGVAPFIYRIGTPFMVAWFFPNNLMQGFKSLNLLANCVTVVLLFLFLRLYLVNWKIRVLCFSLFVLSWDGPVRFVYYYPVYTDPFSFMFILAGLLMLARLRCRFSRSLLFAFSFVTGVGVLFRESVFVLAPAFAFSQLTSFRALKEIKITKSQLLALIPIAFGALGILGTRAIATQVDGYSFFKTVIKWTYTKPPLTYLLGWFLSFGPLIFLPILFWRTAARFLNKEPHLGFILFAFSLLGWIGGTDTERLLFWAAPIVFVLICKILEEPDCYRQLSGYPMLILLVTQLFSKRVFWTIPQHPNLFPSPFPVFSLLTHRAQFLDLYSFHGSLRVKSILLVEYLLLFVFLWAVVNWRKNRLAREVT